MPTQTHMLLERYVRDIPVITPKNAAKVLSVINKRLAIMQNPGGPERDTAPKLRAGLASRLVKLKEDAEKLLPPPPPAGVNVQVLAPMPAQAPVPSRAPARGVLRPEARRDERRAAVASDAAILTAAAPETSQANRTRHVKFQEPASPARRQPERREEHQGEMPDELRDLRARMAQLESNMQAMAARCQAAEARAKRAEDEVAGLRAALRTVERKLEAAQVQPQPEVQPPQPAATPIHGTRKDEPRKIPMNQPPSYDGPTVEEYDEVTGCYVVLERRTSAPAAGGGQEPAGTPWHGGSAVSVRGRQAAAGGGEWARARGGGEEDCGPTLEEVTRHPERYMHDLEDIYAPPSKLWRKAHWNRILRQQCGVDLTKRA